MPAPEQTDEVLMVRVASGDTDAFELLYARHKTTMFNYFLRSAGRRELAEELLQELFLRVFDGRARYEARRPFRVWLYTLARNLLRDRWRRLGRAPQFDEEGTEVRDEAADPESHCSQQEVVGRLRAAILMLSPALREVLILSRFHGLTFAEIAEIVACSEGVARVRLFRAVERLRQLLPAEETPVRVAGGVR